MQAFRSVSDVRLRRANRRGWKLWLTHNTLYPRLVIALLCLTVLPAHCEPSPSALMPSATVAGRYGVVDYSLAASIVAARVLDFTSTEECIRRPATQCHEVELPQSLVHNKAAFAAFEVSTGSLSLFEQYELTKHGHRKMARVIQGANVALMGFVVNHLSFTRLLAVGLPALTVALCRSLPDPGTA
jgi:hypothetical protein